MIRSKEQYHKSMMNMLNDVNTYTKLLSNPMFRCRKALEQVVHLGTKKSILSKKEARFLVPDSCLTPIIYSQPKVHKNGTDPPPRPIVNGIDSLTSRLGEYIDFFLQPVVQSMKAYLRDTKHILQILDGISQRDALWPPQTSHPSIRLYPIIWCAKLPNGV